MATSEMSALRSGLRTLSSYVVITIFLFNLINFSTVCSNTDTPSIHPGMYYTESYYRNIKQINIVQILIPSKVGEKLINSKILILGVEYTYNYDTEIFLKSKDGNDVQSKRPEINDNSIDEDIFNFASNSLKISSSVKATKIWNGDKTSLIRFKVSPHSGISYRRC